MAGGGGKYRHLGRKSSHRQALLRNLVTSLFENESITTTWAKAKEAQRLADKLITLGKKNSEASRRRALEIFYWTVETQHIDSFGLSGLHSSSGQKPHDIIPKLFGPLRERYAERPGGYTRVLRVEPKEKFEYYNVRKGDKNAVPERKPADQAPSAILELVDGPKDMRFAMTARAIARQREEGLTEHELTALNKMKVTRYRKGGVDELEAAVQQLQIRDSETELEVPSALPKSEESKAAQVEAQRSASEAERIAKNIRA
ncbi:54S ribosomal protein L8 [Penicillium diatomitis]|uniref:54S ribosomal protein L8 n=1 Tax=Penicillium diatomitis TaxID=2819901 RepID=A0A9X0BYK8_9EURO|nr:54S ribosomal protein L8 [Penicillium diatomitis]KAJ5489659.1 54S ribosomal protein L8 [Penicillium diatomitis]